jgi:nucleoside-diphosphate kinase
LEKTLVLIKPDAVAANNIGKIISMYEENGLKIGDLYMCIPTEEVLARHYEEHKDKPFYPGLVEFMTSGKIVVVLAEGENAVEVVREINGVTNPASARPGTIRYLYGASVSNNAVHASATLEDASRELSIWFPNCK